MNHNGFHKFFKFLVGHFEFLFVCFWHKNNPIVISKKTITFPVSATTHDELQFLSELLKCKDWWTTIAFKFLFHPFLLPCLNIIYYTILRQKSKEKNCFRLHPFTLIFWFKFLKFCFVLFGFFKSFVHKKLCFVILVIFFHFFCFLFLFSS